METKTTGCAECNKFAPYGSTVGEILMHLRDAVEFRRWFEINEHDAEHLRDYIVKLEQESEYP